MRIVERDSRLRWLRIRQPSTMAALKFSIKNILSGNFRQPLGRSNLASGPADFVNRHLTSSTAGFENYSDDLWEGVSSSVYLVSTQDYSYGTETTYDDLLGISVSYKVKQNVSSNMLILFAI
ncbi:hypothetical protein Aduo_014010 [Ancylostoma duodenale]